jgi:hypothetical protein
MFFGDSGLWPHFIWPILLWSIIWKGLALWRAARDVQKPWFIAILILNTVGILEIIYLLFFAKEKLVLTTKKSPKKK